MPPEPPPPPPPLPSPSSQKPTLSTLPSDIHFLILQETAIAYPYSLIPLVKSCRNIYLTFRAHERAISWLLVQRIIGIARPLAVVVAQWEEEALGGGDGEEEEDENEQEENKDEVDAEGKRDDLGSELTESNISTLILQTSADEPHDLENTNSDNESSSSSPSSSVYTTALDCSCYETFPTEHSTLAFTPDPTLSHLRHCLNTYPLISRASVAFYALHMKRVYPQNTAARILESMQVVKSRSRDEDILRLTWYQRGYEAAMWRYAAYGMSDIYHDPTSVYHHAAGRRNEHPCVTGLELPKIRDMMILHTPDLTRFTKPNIQRLLQRQEIDAYDCAHAVIDYRLEKEGWRFFTKMVAKVDRFPGKCRGWDVFEKLEDVEELLDILEGEDEEWVEGLKGWAEQGFKSEYLIGYGCGG